MSVFKAMLLFSLLYAVSLIVANLIPVDIGYGANSCALIISVFASVHLFVKNNERVPEKSERRKMAWGFLLSSYVISFFAVLITARMNGFYSDLMSLSEDSGIVIVFCFAIIIVSLIYYLILGISIRIFGNLAAKSIHH